MDFTRYRCGLCTVVCTRTKTTKFFLKFFFTIEKFTKKAFQRRVARRYTIKPRVSRFKRNLKKITHFGVVTT